MNIEKGIPIPPRPTPAVKGRSPVYPWPDMAAGDSIFLTASDRSVRSAISSANQYGQRRGWQFVSRSVDGGVRIWRAA